MKLRDIMTRFPQTIGSDEKLLYAREMMLWGQLRHLPVVDGDRLVGILSERDIAGYQARIGESLASNPNATVSMAMQPKPKTAHPDDSVTEAAARLAADRIGCLPITEEGRLVGLVTTTDVLVAEVRRAMEPAPGPLVEEVMTRDPEVIHEDDRVLDAAARMQQKRIRHLPVVDGDRRVLGMLSDRDIRGTIGDLATAFERGARGSSLDALRVRDAMSSPAITTSPTETCANAARAFMYHWANALPVVDADNRLVGIVSYLDLLRLLAA